MSPIKTVIVMCILLVTVAVSMAETGVVGMRPEIEYAQKAQNNRSPCFSQRAYGADTIDDNDMLLLGKVVKTESRFFGRWARNVVTFDVREVILGSCPADTIEFLTTNTFTLDAEGKAAMRESTAMPWVCTDDFALVLLRPNIHKEELKGLSELVYAGFLSSSDFDRDQIIYHQGSVHYDAREYLISLKAATQASPYSHMRITRQAMGTLGEDIQHFREGMERKKGKEGGNE